MVGGRCSSTTAGEHGPASVADAAGSRLLARRPDVVWRNVHAGVLVRPRGGPPLRLSGTGPALWALLAKPSRLDVIAGMLAELHGAEASTVAADLTPVVASLVEREVLEWR